MIKTSHLLNSLFKGGGISQLLTAASLLALYSCHKEEFVTSQQEKDEPKIEQTSVIRSVDDMKRLARVNFGAETRSAYSESIDDKEIVVFPLKIDGAESNLYVVVNYTDNTTVITTEYVNYPAEIILFKDCIMADSSTKEFNSIPDALKYTLNEINLSVDLFGQDSLSVYANNDVQTKRDYEEGVDMPGVRYEVKEVGRYTKRNATLGPWVQTQWNQNSPFNYSSNGNVAGCVAVAIGQLFKYYAHPTNMGYNANVPYNMMPNDNSDVSGVRLYVAPFLRYIGDQINNKWGIEATSANMNDANSFISKYYNVKKYDIRTVFSTDDKDRIVNEINNKRPIIITGEGSGGAHCWVIDGYITEGHYKTNQYTWYDQYGKVTAQYYEENIYGQSFPFLHHNWGWGGNYNCYINIFSVTQASASSIYNDKKNIYLCSKK